MPRKKLNYLIKQIKFFTILLIIFFIQTPCQGLVLEESSQTNTATPQDFATTQNKISSNNNNNFGVGFGIGFRKKIFDKSNDNFDEFEIEYEPPQHFMSQFINSFIYGGEIFINKNFDNYKDGNFGVKLNLGNQIDKIFFYGSYGYLVSNSQLKNQQKNFKKDRLYSEFCGATIGYELTKNYSINFNYQINKLNFKNIDNNQKISQKNNLISINFSYNF